MISFSDELALETLFNKYSIFISKKIKDFHLGREYDDIFQESLILLYKAVEKYEDSEIPFYSYFMQILMNKLSSHYVKNRNRRDYIIDEESYFKEGENNAEFHNVELHDMLKDLTQLELDVTWLFMVEKWRIEDISKKFNLEKNKVSYIIRLSKGKIIERRQTRR